MEYMKLFPSDDLRKSSESFSWNHDIFLKKKGIENSPSLKYDNVRFIS